MRTTILAALTMTTLALSACGGEEPVPQAPPPPPPPPVVTAPPPPPVDTTPPAPVKPALSELIHDSMKTMGDAFNAHDSAKMASVVTDDVAVFDYGTGETHSKGDFQGGMTQLFQWFSDAKVATTRFWKKGNVVISELAWTGTMTGDVMGMKATNKPVGQLRLHVYWFNDDGLIKELHEYADEAGLMAQMQGKKGAPPVPVLPTNPPESHIAGGTPDQDKLADWAKGTDDLFSKDDPKAVLAATAADADYWLSIGGPAMKGKKELSKGLEGWFKAFPDQKWTTVNAWGIDGFGIVEHTMTGTQKGSLGPLPPSRKQVTSWHWVDIMQPTADAKLAHGWGYTNLFEMMAQTGALKKPVDKAAPPPPAGQAKAAGSAPAMAPSKK